MWCLGLLALATAATACDAIQPELYPFSSTPNPAGISWATAQSKANTALQQLSSSDKIALATGQGWQAGPCVGVTARISKISFPGLCLQDGPTGVRWAANVTVFPAGVHAASTWDVDLIRARGRALGEESKGLGVHVQLGPVVGPLGKIPYGGRNWEGFGADAYLAGIAGGVTVEGMQAAGVMANAKHYLGNEQELNRTTIDARIPDRVLHEVYLWPFADLVRAGVASVMCSYNKVNGSWACENPALIRLLKEELEFKGFVVSDWDAQHTTLGSANAGLDMTQPGTDFGKQNPLWGPKLQSALPQLPPGRLDDMARRILTAWYYLGQDAGYPAVTFNSWNGGRGHAPVRANHASIARAVARDGIVLLKNEGGVLPLKPGTSYAVVGEDAGENAQGPNACEDRKCDTGTLGMGWGSGVAEYPYLTSPLAALRAWAPAHNITLTASPTNDHGSAARAAQAAATALVFINADSGEGYITVEGQEGDRADLNPWHDGNGLVASVASIGKPVIVIIHSVGPVILEKILALPAVKAVVWAGLPGQESGSALVDVLSGATAPSGKLPYTIAKQEADYGTVIHKNLVDRFEEGVYVDYRGFDKKGLTPRFEFGYGLSYTTFGYKGLDVANRLACRGVEDVDGAAVPVPAGPAVEGTSIAGSLPQAILYSAYGPVIRTTITNTGSVAGAEVAQLYLSFPKQAGGEEFPPAQLRGFKKVLLKAGESRVVEFGLRRKDVSYWDVRRQTWVVVKGTIGVRVAGSSRAEGVSSSFVLEE